MASDEAASVRVDRSQLGIALVRSDPPAPIAHGSAFASADRRDARLPNRDRHPVPGSDGGSAKRAQIESLTGRSRDLLDSSRQLMIEAYETLQAADAALSRGYDDGG